MFNRMPGGLKLCHAASCCFVFSARFFHFLLRLLTCFISGMKILKLYLYLAAV